MVDVMLFSPAWFVGNAGTFFWIGLILLFAYSEYSKNPLEKPARQMIKSFKRDSFLNKTVSEIECFLEENVDFLDMNYTASELAKEIYCSVNNLTPKMYREKFPQSPWDASKKTAQKIQKFKSLKKISMLGIIIGILISLFISITVGMCIVIGGIGLMLICLIVIKKKTMTQTESKTFGKSISRDEIVQRHAKRIIKNYGHGTFLNKQPDEIEVIVNEYIDLFNIDCNEFTSNDIATEILNNCKGD